MSDVRTKTIEEVCEWLEGPNFYRHEEDEYGAVGEGRHAGGALDAAKAIRREFLEEPCDHDWKDARNEVITSGEWCQKCKAVRAGNITSEPLGAKGDVDGAGSSRATSGVTPPGSPGAPALKWKDDDYVAISEGQVVAVGGSKDVARDRAIARGFHTPLIVVGHQASRKDEKPK